jgi:hypothetical protein
MIGLQERRSFVRSVSAQFMKYAEYKLPVPVDPISDIYRAAFTEKEWIAFRYLRQSKPRCFKDHGEFNLYWTNNTSGSSACPHVAFPFPENMVAPNFGVMVQDLPEITQRKLFTWIKSMNKFRSLHDELKGRVDGLLGNVTIASSLQDMSAGCNTPGQLYRIWPELQPFFPTEWKSVTRKASMKSRLPSHVSYKGCTPDTFRCRHSDCPWEEKQRFEDITDVLRRLALAVDIPRIEGYPTFFGPTN